MIQSLKLTSFATLGAFATLAQVAILRLLIARFDSNELLISIALFFWLFITGISSAIFGHLADKTQNHKPLIITAFFVCSLATPFSSIIIEKMPFWLSGTNVLLSSPIHVAITVFFAVLPVALPLGFLFAFLIKEARGNFGKSLSSFGLFDALGSIFGGFLFTVILINFLKTDGLVLYSMFFALLGSVIWIYLFDLSKILKLLTISAFLILTIGAFFLSENLKADENFDIIETSENRHGILNVVKRNDQFSIFSGFSPLVDCNDWETPEEIAVILAPFTKAAKETLVLGGNLSFAAEISKQSRTKSTFIRTNPDLTNLEFQYCDKSKGHLTSINIIHDDEKSVINSLKSGSYDILFVFAGLPDSIVKGRTSTVEFFTEAKKILDNGTVILQLQQASNYLTNTESLIISSIYDAGKTAFANCKIFPLGHNWLVCSEQKLPKDGAEFVLHYEQKSLNNRHKNAAWIRDEMSDSRMQVLGDAIAKNSGKLTNSDLKPVAPIFGILFWAGHFDAGFLELEPVSNSAIVISLLALLSIIIISIFFGKKLGPNAPVLLFIASLAGASGIASELILITAFQAGHGALYYRIGLIVATYMVGLGIGFYLADIISESHKTENKKSLLFSLFGLLVSLCLMMISLSFIAGKLHEFQATILTSFLLFFVSLSSGFLFVVSSKMLYLNHPEKQGTIAGIMFGIDYFAAAISALIFGLIFLPIFGAFYCTIILLLFSIICLMLVKILKI